MPQLSWHNEYKHVPFHQNEHKQQYSSMPEKTHTLIKDHLSFKTLSVWYLGTVFPGENMKWWKQGLQEVVSHQRTSTITHKTRQKES